ALGAQPHMPLLPAIPLRLGDLLAIREKKPGLKMVKSPIEELLAFVAALLLAAQSIHDDNQAHSVLHRRSDQTVSRFLGEPRFEAVGADAHGKQRVAIVLPDLVPGEFVLAV